MAALSVDVGFRGLISAEQFGDAAIAVLAEDGCEGGISYVDIFTLSGFGEAWKIVSKTFTHTGGKMPGAWSAVARAPISDSHLFRCVARTRCDRGQKLRFRTANGQA